MPSFYLENTKQLISENKMSGEDSGRSITATMGMLMPLVGMIVGLIVCSVIRGFKTISFLSKENGFVVFCDEGKKTVRVIEKPTWSEYFQILLNKTFTPRGLQDSIFQRNDPDTFINPHNTFCTPHHVFTKRGRNRQFAVPVKIDDVPYEIDVSVDAVITDANKFVFHSLELDMCRHIDNKLYDALSDMFDDITTDMTLETFGGRTLTEFDDNGIEHTFKVVRMRDMNKEIEKKKVALEVFCDELEEFRSNAVLSSVDAAKKDMEMNAKITRIKREINEIPRTKVYRLF